MVCLCTRVMFSVQNIDTNALNCLGKGTTVCVGEGIAALHILFSFWHMYFVLTVKLLLMFKSLRKETLH